MCVCVCIYIWLWIKTRAVAGPSPSLLQTCVAGPLLQTLVVNLCVEYCSLQGACRGGVCRRTPLSVTNLCHEMGAQACYKANVFDLLPYIYICICICLAACLPACLPVCLSKNLSIYICLCCLRIDAHVYTHICVYIYTLDSRCLSQVADCQRNIGSSWFRTDCSLPARSQDRVGPPQLGLIGSLEAPK